MVAWAQSIRVLQGVLAKAYPDPSTRPLVIGPDTTGCGGANSSGDLRELLAAEPAWNVTTVHLYSVVPNVNASTFLAAAQSNAMCGACVAPNTRTMAKQIVWPTQASPYSRWWTAS
jgi:hypothetical protein